MVQSKEIMKKALKILKVIFTVLFRVSLCPYLIPWVWAFWGLIYGSGESIFDRFQVYGWDAFAHSFIWGTLVLLLFIIPVLIYQVIYLICNRKNKILTKVIIVVSLPIVTTIMYLICHAHFSTVDLDLYRTHPRQELEQQGSLSTTRFSESTGRYYEETHSGYKAAFYEKDEVEIERIQRWLSSCEPSDMYYSFIFSDPESWNMYIYYSPENASFGAGSFKFTIEEQIARVFVTTDNSSNVSRDYILIRIQAPSRGIWPNSSKLFLDDIEVEQHDVAYG